MAADNSAGSFAILLYYHRLIMALGGELGWRPIRIGGRISNRFCAVLPAQKVRKFREIVRRPNPVARGRLIFPTGVVRIPKKGKRPNWKPVRFYAVRSRTQKTDRGILSPGT